MAAVLLNYQTSPFALSLWTHQRKLILLLAFSSIPNLLVMRARLRNSTGLCTHFLMVILSCLSTLTNCPSLSALRVIRQSKGVPSSTSLPPTPRSSVQGMTSCTTFMRPATKTSSMAILSTLIVSAQVKSLLPSRNNNYPLLHSYA